MRTDDTGGQSRMGGTGRSEAGIRQRFVVWPHRSLSRAGTILLIGAVAVAFGLTSMRAAFVGAWPVVAYPMLALVGFVYALHRNNRAARRAQIIEIGEHLVRVKEVGPASTRDEPVEFNPYWIRVAERAIGKDSRAQIALCQGDRSVIVGEFLSEDERALLAKELRCALRRRRPPLHGIA
jgi:uncharacterized membrane protein